MKKLLLLSLLFFSCEKEPQGTCVAYKEASGPGYFISEYYGEVDCSECGKTISNVLGVEYKLKCY